RAVGPSHDRVSLGRRHFVHLITGPLIGLKPNLTGSTPLTIKRTRPIVSKWMQTFANESGDHADADAIGPNTVRRPGVAGRAANRGSRQSKRQATFADRPVAAPTRRIPRFSEEPLLVARSGDAVCQLDPHTRASQPDAFGGPDAGGRGPAADHGDVAVRT